MIILNSCRGTSLSSGSDVVMETSCALCATLAEMGVAFNRSLVGPIHTASKFTTSPIWSSAPSDSRLIEVLYTPSWFERAFNVPAAQTTFAFFCLSV